MTPIEIIGFLGGSGALIFGLSAWLGKIWANRIAARERAEIEARLNTQRSGLELDQSRVERGEEAQFQLYNEVWQKLQNLKFYGDDLWEAATISNLRRFIEALEHANKAIEKGRLLLSENHYSELKRLLAEFGEYSVGKEKLIELRSSKLLSAIYENNTEEQILAQIQRNAQHKDSYESLLEEIVVEFKERLHLDE